MVTYEAGPPLCAAPQTNQSEGCPSSGLCSRTILNDAFDDFKSQQVCAYLRLRA